MGGDLEGQQLGCNGTISLMQLYVKSLGRIYLVDMATLGNSAFTTTTVSYNQEHSLKTISEDADIEMLFFDCRGDAEALEMIHDTQNRRSAWGLTVRLAQRLLNTNISDATLQFLASAKCWVVLTMQYGYEIVAREYEYYAGDQEARDDFLLQHAYFQHIRERTERHRLWFLNEEMKAAAKPMATCNSRNDAMSSPASDISTTHDNECVGPDSPNSSDIESMTGLDSISSNSTGPSSSPSITTVGFPTASPLTFIDVFASDNPMTSSYSPSLSAKNEPFAIRPLP
ncbi:hypothetical protein LTR95_000210 [Oleoguttula sp. CCFEE 5521]